MKPFLDGNMTDRYFMNEVADYGKDLTTWNASGEVGRPVQKTLPASSSSSTSVEFRVVRRNPWHKNMDRIMF